jgi:hypothetical protein
MRESVVEKYCVDVAGENGFLCYKFTSPSINGIPDRIVIGHGLIFFIELKAPGKKPRKLQEVVIARLRNHGALVYVADTKEKIDEIFQEINEKYLTS